MRGAYVVTWVELSRSQWPKSWIPSGHYYLTRSPVDSLESTGRFWTQNCLQVVHKHVGHVGYYVVEGAVELN